MPYYMCRLASDEGKIFLESRLATSPAECRRQFESEGLCVLSVRRDLRKQKLPSLSLDNKIKDRDFIMFNQELMALVRAGYPVLRSIEVIGNRVKNPRLKEILVEVEHDIRHGKSLSEAFAPFEDRFSKIYTAALMAGEQSGNLPDTVGQYIQYAKVISQTKGRIRSALIYPTMLLLFSFALLGVLLNFVLPNFSEFYKDFDAQLPLFTVLLINGSTFIRAHWYVWLLGTLVAVIAYSRLRKNPRLVLKTEKAKLRIPLGKTIWLESAVSLFGRTLSLLLQAGVPLLSGVGLAIQAIPNKYLAHKASILPAGIKNGESLSESMTKAGFFPPLALDMVRIGETSANLGGMLREVADVFDASIQSLIDTFVSLIEPIVIIFMGLLVAGMLLAVYMPIFNIIKVAR